MNVKRCQLGVGVVLLLAKKCEVLELVLCEVLELVLLNEKQSILSQR